jgi:hypothetical protein
MALLFGKRGDEIKIIEEVVETVVENVYCDPEVMTVLLV